MRHYRRILRSLEQATEGLHPGQKLNTASLVRAFLQVEAGGEPVSLWDQDGRLIMIDRAYVDDAKRRAEQADQALMEQLGSMYPGWQRLSAP